jgi:phosphoribosyl-AMP cyclohydrolase
MFFINNSLQACGDPEDTLQVVIFDSVIPVWIMSDDISNKTQEVAHSHQKSVENTFRNGNMTSSRSRQSWRKFNRIAIFRSKDTSTRVKILLQNL